MASKSQFRKQDIAVPQAGTKVRTVIAGAHRVRIAFPKGARKKGSGQIVSILHPMTEKNPEGCGAILNLAAADVATLSIPVSSLSNGFGSGFENALETATVANPSDWQWLWEQFKEKVKAAFTGEGHCAEAQSNPDRKQWYITHEDKPAYTTRHDAAGGGWRGPYSKIEIAELLGLDKGSLSPKTAAGIAGAVPLFGKSNPKKSWYGVIELKGGGEKYTRDQPSFKKAIAAAAKAIDDHPDWKPDIVTYGAHRNPRVKRNYTEQVQTSDGKTMFVDMVESGGKFLASGFLVSGKKIKHVARAVTARGETEAEAYDALLAKVERNPKGKKGKKNLDQIGQAAELAAKFKGSPAENIREIELSNKQRDDYAHLGWVDQQVFHPPFDLVALDLSKISEDYDRMYQKSGDSVKTWRDLAAKHGIVLLVFDLTGDEIELAASANGQQLYFLGGKQASFANHLAAFKVDTARDKVDLGELVSVTYTAKKEQAGDTEPRGYYHIFGEEKGSAPRAYFDMLNMRTFLMGGSYHLKEAERGIIN